MSKKKPKVRIGPLKLKSSRFHKSKKTYNRQKEKKRLKLTNI